MVFGVGIDILDLARLEKVIERHQSRFLERIFSQAERDYCLSKKRPALHFAGRFAAKEAFLKAIGRRDRDGIAWREIEVLSKKGGPPSYRLSGRAEETIKKLPGIPDDAPVSAHSLKLSITHSGGYAAAVCLINTVTAHPGDASRA